ncbi:MAG: sensor domain-containing diguanylate cyclase [Gammaproteobacteria bacterium]|nr:sensor domain-containing diguanylate cyclase [Gammaproteobacteria bacterium]
MSSDTIRSQSEKEINNLCVGVSDKKLAEACFRNIFMSAPIGLTLCEGNSGDIIEANLAYSQITGRELEEIKRIGWSSYTHPEDLRKFQIYIQQLYDGIVHTEKLIKRIIKPDNSVIWAELSMTPVNIGDDTGRRQYLTVVEDITERRKIADKIWRQANYDFLTGLPNRNMFQDRLAQIIKKQKREAGKFALLLIDLDEFKEVNDRFGHDQGDELLVEAARRIEGCIRVSDTVSRLGGDEFVIILEEVSSRDDVARVAKNVNEILVDKFTLGEGVAFVSASIGVTLFPQDAEETMALIRNADQAMYESKKRGRNQYQFFTQSIADAAAARRLRSGINSKSVPA